MIIGVKEFFPYEQGQIQLEEGDILLMYTDGVIEAESRKGEFFGEARLAEILATNSHLGPQSLIELVFDQVRLFTGQHNFQDDVSLVIMQISPENDSLTIGTRSKQAEKNT